MSALAPPRRIDPDAARLRELGYDQELERRMGALDSVAMGFATTSPVVGLYAVILVGTLLAGPAWVWVLPVAFAGQCLLLVVYAELAAEFPISGGAYQWTRRLLGDAYGWLAGWVAICAYAAGNTTIAYLGAPWALTVLGIAPSPPRIVAAGMVLVALCTLIGLGGIDLLRRVVRVGAIAEAVAVVAIGTILLVAFRQQDLSILTSTLGAGVASSGSVGAALLAALAVAGWVFVGFDACVSTSEETRGAARRVPRAVWVTLLSVGVLVMLSAITTTLSHPDPAAVVAGRDADPVSTAVVSSFGSWSMRPFAVLVLFAFISCGVAAQALTARTVYSVARDGVLPGARLLRAVNRRGVPVGGSLATAAAAAAALLLGLESTAIGSVIAFGTAALYLAFLLTATAALVARRRGTWRPGGHVQLGRWGFWLNALAVVWLAFETVNIAWPRAALAPAGAPAYQVWAAPLLLTAIVTSGVAYLLIAKPHRRAGGRAT